MTRFDHLDLAIEGEVATIRLTRPEKKNCMNPTFHQNMHDALTEVETRGGVKVTVITGSGDSFCGGMDLEQSFLEPFDKGPEEFTRVMELAVNWFRRLKAFPAVSAASVNGWCFGGGVELVGVCDIAIAAEEAVFGLSEVNFGMIPGGGTMWATAHHLNRKPALYYMLTGEVFSGREAVALGLVNRAVPLADLAEETQRTVDVLVRKNIHTLRAIKEVYERSVSMNFAEGTEWEMAKLHELSYKSRDAWIRVAIEQFRQRTYRPGIQPYTLE